MTNYDGPTLRAVREHLGMPLRKIARQAGMSHGHLSKMERGEYGRPVTPAILAAYQRVTGVDLADLVDAATNANGSAQPAGTAGKAWRPGQLNDIRRQSYTAGIGALSIGGQLGEPVGRLIDGTGRPLTPAPPDEIDIAQLTQLAGWIISLDLRHGGGLVSQFTKTLLRWAVPMLDAIDPSDPVSTRLHAAIGALAHRAAWAAFDCDAHEPARSLFRLALYAATRANDRNLRAYVLADIAAQYSALGYHDDCLEIMRIAGGDEQVTPAVGAMLHGVKARAYAATGNVNDCYHSLERLEATHADASPDKPGWLATLAHPAHMHASMGHALATLADASGDTADVHAAHKVLTLAIDAFDPQTHARARALCLSRLAALHLRAGELEEGARWARLARQGTATVRSARLSRQLDTIRQQAAAHPNEPSMRELVAQIDATHNTDRTPP